jgi:hypothetical protein
VLTHSLGRCSEGASRPRAADPKWSAGGVLAAAAALAFEAAERISQEIAALSWTTAEQRVTHPGAGDAVIHGWADGVPCSFEQRDGRIDRWVERECSAADAERPLQLTPPSWVTFATEAARLASALRGRPAGHSS